MLCVFQLRLKRQAPKKISAATEAALKEAVRGVVERHKKSGRSLAVWENGRTVRISPNAVK